MGRSWDFMGCTLWEAFTKKKKPMGKWPIQFVDLPMKHGDFPWRTVSLPEGNYGKSPFSMGKSTMSKAMYI